MPHHVIAPVLSADRQNKRLLRVRQRAKEAVILKLRSVLQTGYPPGTEPARDRYEEYHMLSLREPQHLATMDDPLAPPTARLLSQRELLRLRDLEQELFGG